MDKLLARSLKYLSGRSYSEHELRLKLEQDFFSLSDFEEQIEKTMQRLKELHVLNDQRIAEHLAQRLSHKGDQWIKQALKQKGIKEEVIIKVISLLDKELERALLVAKKKLTSLQKEEPYYQLEKRLYRFLLGRGFSPQSIRKAVALLRPEYFAYD